MSADDRAAIMWQPIDFDQLGTDVPHPSDASKSLPKIKQVHIRSRCKVCQMYLIHPGLLESVNTWLAAGVRHRLIIGWVEAWAKVNTELNAEDLDNCDLTPNNLSTHRKHINPEVEALRDFEYTRGMIEAAEQGGVPPSLAAVRSMMVLTHKEMMSRDLSEVSTEQLLKAIPQLGRTDATIEGHLWDKESTDAEKARVALEFLSQKLSQKARALIHAELTEKGLIDDGESS